MAAVITYVVDAVFKLLELRRKLRAERLAAGSGGDAKVEEPYVDDVQQSPAATETEAESVTATDEPQSPTTD